MSGQFSDISKTEKEIDKKKGIEIGLKLLDDRRMFLRKTKIYQMKLKKKREQYIKLFNKPETIET